MRRRRLRTSTCSKCGPSVRSAGSTSAGRSGTSMAAGGRRSPPSKVWQVGKPPDGDRPGGSNNKGGREPMAEALGMIGCRGVAARGGGGGAEGEPGGRAVLLGRVVGTLVASRKEATMEGRKFLVARQIDVDESDTSGYVVAVDGVGAGGGEVVMYATGSSARQTVATRDRPCDAVIMAIVDTWEV